MYCRYMLVLKHKLHSGAAVPVNEEAVGWQIAVLWNSQGCFARATVDSYLDSEKQHNLTYAEGHQETLDLATQCVKWVQAVPLKQVQHSPPPPLTPFPPLSPPATDKLVLSLLLPYPLIIESQRHLH